MRAKHYLASLKARLTPIARDRCDYWHAETGYQPSRALRHLIAARSARCDLDHTTA